MRAGTVVGRVAACAVAVAACSGTSSTPSAASIGARVTAGRPFPADRCAQNRAAGTINYVSGYDYAAAASIVDVLVAKRRGYFDAMCLDVHIAPGLASSNYGSVADNEVQFSSSGSFGELAGAPTPQATAQSPTPGLVALAVEGKSAIDTLIVKPGLAPTLASLRGATIGIKGALPPSIQAMLATAGLVDGTDYTTRQLDGFDPVSQLAGPQVTAITGFQSNEPGQLERAGVPFSTFEPSSVGIPGSFGVIYTNRTFLDAHPTAAVDFMRATMYALTEAITDPGSASMVAVDYINDHGNPNNLSPEGEAFRWQTESKVIVESTPKDEPIGIPDAQLLQREIDADAAVGLFGGNAPDISDLYDRSVLTTIYNPSRAVIWPVF
ncbi:MAG: hypothetical protein JWN39_1497 [Ilumatobacteraceae bacterium]|nr:hypothetical protein [Ilumatobacteraceae bacterium]